MLEDSPIFAVIPCVDLKRARKFYSDTLGLETADMEIPEGEDVIAYQGGGGTGLLVYRRETPTKADHTVASFMVADLGATLDGLAERGVSPERYDLPGMEMDERGIVNEGPYSTAWITDPEGNIISLFEHTA